MTWRELRDDIDRIDPRFLDTYVEFYDVNNDRTFISHDSMLVLDDDNTDYRIDKDQPQIWFNFDEFQ